jgi:hypothetical protein
MLDDECCSARQREMNGTKTDVVKCATKLVQPYSSPRHKNPRTNRLKIIDSGELFRKRCFSELN